MLIDFFATYLILIFIPVGFYLVYRRDRVTLFRVSASVLLALLLSTLIKDFYYLPRPFILSGHLPRINYGLDGSLPSGHTALSFAFSFALFSRNHQLGRYLLIISSLIAFGRIAGGVHTFFDVLIGIIVALISFG
jgi:undecaprenyl-diphosphatase